MKLLFVMPYNSDLIHAVPLPLGLISIATHLKHHGYDVKICDMSVSRVNIQKVFDEFSPDVVGISLSSVKHLSGALYVSKKLRKKGVPIVWGGPFCDVADAEILMNGKEVDCISFCEGEETWLEIAKNLESGKGFDGIKGIAYKDSNEKIIVTPQRNFIDLTTLPVLDYSLVDVIFHGLMKKCTRIPVFFQKFLCCYKLFSFCLNISVFMLEPHKQFFRSFSL